MDFSPDTGCSGVDDWEPYLRMNRIHHTDVFETWDRKRLLTIDDRATCRYFVKDIIEEKLLMMLGSKVRNFEHLVKNTKKGFANAFKNYFNKKERSENDGLSKDFKMNVQEVSMKSLIDLSFLFQDYRTFNNYLKYPINDFKAIKAFKQYSSCFELQFFTSLLSIYNFSDSREFSANLFQAANLYSHSKDLKWMIRNLIILADMCKTIGKYNEGAK